MTDNIRFEIQKHYGVLLTRDRSRWTKELNLVSWDDKPAKFDIREWDEGHERMSRGITFTETEAKILYEILKSVFDSDK